VREDYLVVQIVALLRSHGLPAWRTHDARHHPAEKGIADVNAVLPGGLFLAIEVKREGDENAHPDRRVAQNNWLGWVGRSGAVTATVSNLDEVMKIIKEKT
jgi:hypothetical protein